METVTTKVTIRLGKTVRTWVQMSMRRVVLFALATAACSPAEEAAQDEGSSTAVTSESGARPTGDDDDDDDDDDVDDDDDDVDSTGDPASTDTSGSTSSDATDTGTSGRQQEPEVSVALITDTNRAYDNMHGGWGPHLRAPMQASDGSLWFAYDGGPNVLENTTIHYARRDDAGWTTVASQAHGAGIQQNTAHVLRNDILLTYGVNTGSSVLEECYFDTNDYGYAACNTIQIGGAYSTPPASNYVGAALGPNNEKVVWFTVVGASGGTGQFIYAYDFGGGWNGPVVTALPGYNDMAYVRAHFRVANEIAWLGQAYIGAYPNGSFALGVDEVTLGNAPSFQTLGPSPMPDETVRNAGDVWIDPDTGDAHGLGRVDGVMHYYFVPAGEAWAEHLQPVQSLDGVVRARFARAGDGPLVMLASGGGMHLRWAPPGGAVDWDAADTLDVMIPVEGFDSPTALYAAGDEYQSEAMSGIHFAVCGQFQVADDQIWHVELDGLD